jgi:hypothetical protein
VPHIFIHSTSRAALASIFDKACSGDAPPASFDWTKISSTPAIAARSFFTESGQFIIVENQMIVGLRPAAEKKNYTKFQQQ